MLVRCHKKRTYAAVEGRLAELWSAYEHGELSVTQLSVVLANLSTLLTMHTQLKC